MLDVEANGNLGRIAMPSSRTSLCLVAVPYSEVELT